MINILEENLQEVSNRYSNFAEIIEAINKFILVKNETGENSRQLEYNLKLNKKRKNNQSLDKLLSSEKSLKISKVKKKTIIKNKSINKFNPINLDSNNDTNLDIDSCSDSGSDTGSDTGFDTGFDTGSDTDVINVTDVTQNVEDLKLIYSAYEEQFLAQLYSSKLDYAELFKTENLINEKFDFYEIENIKNNNGSETMETAEAEKTMGDVQLAYVLGSKNDVDYKTRKRLANWASFNPVMLRIFESQAVTRDVNYSEY